MKADILPFKGLGWSNFLTLIFNSRFVDFFLLLPSSSGSTDGFLLPCCMLVGVRRLFPRGKFKLNHATTPLVAPQCFLSTSLLYLT